MDLTPYRGSHRLILIFAPSISDGRYREQESLLADEKSGLEDRDLVPARILEDGTGSVADKPITAEAASARHEHGVEDGRFAVALVGKDGGVKFRSGEPVPKRELFDRIDAMPMRRREMRVRGSGSG